VPAPTRAAAAHAAVVAAIEGAGDDEWLARPAYPGARRPSLADLLGRVLGAPNRPFGHAFAHLDDLRDYAGSLGRA